MAETSNKKIEDENDNVEEIENIIHEVEEKVANHYFRNLLIGFIVVIIIAFMLLFLFGKIS